MIHLITAATARVYVFLGRYMPTNRLIAAIRTRRGLKWGALAMLLAVPYLYAAVICTTIIGHGGPRWLYLAVLLLVWDALKVLWIGPISLASLVRILTRKVPVHDDSSDMSTAG